MPENSHSPSLSRSQAVQLVQRLYDVTPTEVRPLPSYDDQNFHVTTTEGGQYVLKIMNSEDSRNQNLLELQTYSMSFLQQRGLPTQAALPTTSGQIMSLEEIDCGNGCQKYMVRLLSYKPGMTVSKVPYTPQLLYDIGKLAAHMDMILAEMKHPHISVLHRDKFKWSLSNVILMEDYLHIIEGEPLGEMVKSIIHLYKTSVVGKYSDLRKSINHGDLNDLNILVQPDDIDGHRISGILDFGDMHSGYYIHELAIVITYMMIEHPNPVEVGGAILAGWESVFPLNTAERECLYVLVLCRFCQSLLFARHAVTLNPENEEYLMLTSKKGIPILKLLWGLGKDEVERVWFQSASQFTNSK